MANPPAQTVHPNSPEHLADMEAFLKELNSESARGAVLTIGAMIDDFLGRCLRSFLIEGRVSDKLFEGMNPAFGTFSSKISGAWALGLISEAERDACEMVRKVRNRFAHEVSVNFGDQQIVSWCINIKFGVSGLQERNPRALFTMSGVSLICHLYNRPTYVARKRLKYENWPY